MRAVIAGVVLAVVMVASALGPADSVAFAETESTVDQVIVDDQSLSNTWRTLDNGPNNDGQPDSDSQQQQCKCMAGPAGSLADCC